MKVNSFQEVQSIVLEIMHSRMKEAVGSMHSDIISDPTFPRDTSELISSEYIETKKEPNKVIGKLGNTAEHAFWLHEGTGIYALNGQGRKTPWKVVNVRYKGKLQSFWTHGIKPTNYISKHTLSSSGLEKISRILKGGNE